MLNTQDPISALASKIRHMITHDVDLKFRYDLETVSRHFLGQGEKQTKVKKNLIKENEPQVFQTEVDQEGEECTICFEPLDDQTKMLTCGHIYHDECVSNWLSNYKNTCPYCRARCKEGVSDDDVSDDDVSDDDSDDDVPDISGLSGLDLQLPLFDSEHARQVVRFLQPMYPEIHKLNQEVQNLNEVCIVYPNLERKDIELVSSQVSCSFLMAAQALNEANGSIVFAIMRLTM